MAELTLDGWTRKHIEQFTQVRFNSDWDTIHTTKIVPVTVDFGGAGIQKGDKVTVKNTCRYKEGELGFWCIKDEGYKTGSFYTFAYAFACFGDVIIDWNNGCSERFNPQDVKLLGVVECIQRELKPVPLSKPERTEKPKQSDTTEITVVCDDCGTSMTGTRKFLTGMAWKIKKGSTYCVSCR